MSRLLLIFAIVSTVLLLASIGQVGLLLYWGWAVQGIGRILLRSLLALKTIVLLILSFFVGQALIPGVATQQQRLAGWTTLAGLLLVEAIWTNWQLIHWRRGR